MLTYSRPFIFHSRFLQTSTTPILDSSHRLLEEFLQSSIDKKCLKLAQQSHTQIFSLGFSQDSFLATKLISAYSVCGSPTQSHLVFNSVHHKNVFLWNSLISGYAKNRFYEESFKLFNEMCTQDGRIPDNYTFSTLLKSSGDLRCLKIGEMIHCRIIQIGYVSDTVLVNSLMGMYFKCETYYNIRKLFDEMPHRSTASWNVLISGYTVLGNFSFTEDIWKLVKQMQIEGVKLDKFTVSSLLPLCGTADNTGKLDYGREIHCFALKNDMCLGSSDLHVGCCLIDMYSKTQNLTLGRRVFDGMSCRNIVAWTAMITGYVQNGYSEQALMLFREMQLREGIEPNRVSLVCILPAFSSVAGLREGKQIHGFSIRNELNHEVSLSNALIDMYSKCGSLDSGRCIFDNFICSKDAISWSSMIAGYGLHGNGDEAISLYNKMLQLGVKPDNITLVGVLSACSRSGLLNAGFEIYNAAVTDHGISLTLEICACMVDMLGRAGQLDEALEFINSMPLKPGPSVWGALFGASVIHENSKMRDLTSRYLIQLEPENPSNYVSLSNLHASFGRWDVVSELRRGMKDKGLRKLPGCSWITIGAGEIHSFYVADKTHLCSTLIYKMLDDLISMMKCSHYFPDLENLTQ